MHLISGSIKPKEENIAKRSDRADHTSSDHYRFGDLSDHYDQIDNHILGGKMKVKAFVVENGEVKELSGDIEYGLRMFQESSELGERLEKAQVYFDDHPEDDLLEMQIHYMRMYKSILDERIEQFIKRR